jgi:hypothetical protein
MQFVLEVAILECSFLNHIQGILGLIKHQIWEKDFFQIVDYGAKYDNIILHIL